MFNVWEGVSADSACYCDIWVYFGVEMVGKRGGAVPDPRPLKGFNGGWRVKWIQ